MEQIFWLQSDVRTDDRLPYLETAKFDVQLCDKDRTHSKYQRAKRPLQIIAPINPRTDFQWTVFGDCVVTSEVKNAFEEAQLTGIEFNNIECHTTTGLRLEQEVFEMVVTGWGGVAPPASGVHVVEECQYCGRKIYSGYSNPSLLFDLDAWDGSDLFLIWPLPRYIMAVLAVKNVVEQRGFSGATLASLEKLPKVIAGTLTPGHLGDWFEQTKARQLRT